MSTQSIESTVLELAKNAQKAALSLAAVPESQKNAFLDALIAQLDDEENQHALISANQMDLDEGRKNGLSKALLDRLAITPSRIESMIQGTEQVRNLHDPVGELVESKVHPTGFELQKIRVPIGVIGIIYESRPNVTIDCAILCLKSGNATILRGGKEAFHSNSLLAKLIQKALVEADLPKNAVQLIPTSDRQALTELLKLEDYVHCIIPRGGEGLIRFVSENARMPVIKHYKGVCNIYVEDSIDTKIASEIVINAKCQRPSVCNAAENLLIEKSALTSHAVPICQALIDEGVELRVDEPIAKLLAANKIPYSLAKEEDYYEEYLDKIIALKSIQDVEEAIDFVNQYGSSHSDAILTANEEHAKQFQLKVDSATVYWNVSTRFTDGFEFGLGAEIGISTDKLHARGPMGLTELTTYKFIIKGNGQIKA